MISRQGGHNYRSCRNWKSMKEYDEELCLIMWEFRKKMTKFSKKIRNFQKPDKMKHDKTVLKPQEIKLRMKNLFSEISESNWLRETLTQHRNCITFSQERKRRKTSTYLMRMVLAWHENSENRTSEGRKLQTSNFCQPWQESPQNILGTGVTDYNRCTLRSFRKHLRCCLS